MRLPPLYDIVVPTIGRPSLATLVAALEREATPQLGDVVLVDDRTGEHDDPVFAETGRLRVRIKRSGGHGPAAARNAGIAATTAEWIVFVDDDVEPPPGWGAQLVSDLRGAPLAVGGVQGRIVVPLPDRPTDWERNVAGLERAAWPTADMAYRRRALRAAGGFDERFADAYREDADLALRVLDAGFELQRGIRVVYHPVRQAPWWVSIAKQRGNADDVVMRRLHGSDWRTRAQAPAGRLRTHLATTAVAGVAAGALGTKHKAAGLTATALWLGATAEFALRRIAPGPRTRREVLAMSVTSAVIPFAATAWWLRGLARARGIPRVQRLERRAAAVDAVVVDRDGTIVVDVPYNGDPDRVRVMPGAPAALDRLRRVGLPVVIATNQSGIARGLLTPNQVERVNARVDQLLGPFAGVFVCPHGDGDECGCRKPAPGLVVEAARAVGADPTRCVVIGDCAADVEAARAAGAHAILVPNERTRHEEVVAAPVVAADLAAAVDYVLGMVRA